LTATKDQERQQTKDESVQGKFLNESSLRIDGGIQQIVVGRSKKTPNIIMMGKCNVK